MHALANFPRMLPRRLLSGSLAIVIALVLGGCQTMSSAGLQPNPALVKAEGGDSPDAGPDAGTDAGGS